MVGFQVRSIRLLACCALAAHACGTARPAPRPAAENRCVVAEEHAGADTIVLVLDGALDPGHAPVPATLAERVGFGALYHTLLHVDCEGRVRPGLAARWRREDGGRRWVFELRADAAFVDGTPLTASAVAASWRLAARRRPEPWADSVGGSVAVRGDRELVMEFDRPHATVPAVLAHPGLAIARPGPDGAPWPLGTGAYAITEASPDRMIAEPRGAMERDALPTLVLRGTRNDPRDLVDAGFNLLVTRDPAVSTYAIAGDSTRMVPLPWDVTYVLAAPAEAGASRQFQTIRVREDFTPAAVAADARTAGSAFWWERADCPMPTVAAVSVGDPAARIVYRREDRTARGLAERIVALAASGRMQDLTPGGAVGPRLVARGLAAAEYDVAVATGVDVGYVMALDRTVLDSCTAVSALLTAAPWPVRLVPLVETRAHLVVRHLSVAVAVDWDGSPLLVPPGPGL